MQAVPGLIAQAAARRARRADGDPYEQQPGHGRREHVRVAHQQRLGLADNRRVRGHRVAPDDQQPVGDDEADRVAAAHRVPACQPVGADTTLERRDACHQGDEDDDTVASEQPGDPPGVGQPVTKPVQRLGVVPPQADGDHSSGHDQPKDDGRMSARPRRRRRRRRHPGQRGPPLLGDGAHAHLLRRYPDAAAGRAVAPGLGREVSPGLGRARCGSAATSRADTGPWRGQPRRSSGGAGAAFEAAAATDAVSEMWANAVMPQLCRRDLS